MNEEARELLRGFAQRSRAKAQVPRLQDLGCGMYLCLEWMPVLGGGLTGRIPCGTILSLFLGERGAKVFRVDDYKDKPGWQGEIDCHPQVLRRHFGRLTRLGLWELNDFSPAAELLDGEYFIVQARDSTDGQCVGENRRGVANERVAPERQSQPSGPRVMR